MYDIIKIIGYINFREITSVLFSDALHIRNSDSEDISCKFRSQKSIVLQSIWFKKDCLKQSSQPWKYMPFQEII